jgi:predicted nucleic acid-binding protein
MKIVVDSNIIFSAILNSTSRIGQLLLLGTKHFDFYSVDLLKDEISKHQKKIFKTANYDQSEYLEILDLLISKIKFVDTILISQNDLIKAIDLVADVDENDALFIALTNHLHCNLWTGDKKLISGLKTKGYNHFITTEELYELYIEKELKSRLKNK